MTLGDPSRVVVLPDDEHNRRLVGNVHPPNWINPTPAGRYNLVVIGAGTAGLVTAAVAAGLGAKVALIERHLMGGDCLNVGCVPSKGLIAASRVWSAVQQSAAFGIGGLAGVTHDVGMAMARMRRLRARISPNDSARRFAGLGVDVFIGDGHFAGPGVVDVAGTRLEFVKAVICTGARPTVPLIPGLAEAGYLTNETIFSLTDRPRRLAVIGAGPIGCEMGQAFARFGSRVVVFDRVDRILPRDDADAAAVVRARMARDGVTFALRSQVKRVEQRAQEKVVVYDVNGATHESAVDDILVAVGRIPNVERLRLDTVGVAFNTTSGVTVNDYLQTTNPQILAAGDVCSRFQFTHAADAHAQIVIQNALFPHPFGLGMSRVSSLMIPRVTYTEPEVAHVGMTEADARAAGIACEAFAFNLDEVDRAILDGEDEGFARVRVKKGTDTILGATIVSSRAGDLISEVTVAMRNGLGLSAIAGTIHPYPTQAEVLKRVATMWRKSTFTPGKQRLLKRWFAWMR
jgi:pyruvate/2-oxoglutarate dehydrogenase complex dihydrolipoamide dehydrogenase (E3) component